MRTVKEITQETIDSFIENMSLVTFYERVAEELHTIVQAEDVFDCRKICVSKEIQEQWIQQFEEKLGKERLFELFRMLCIAGPKVNQQLKNKEVAVEENWICKED